MHITMDRLDETFVPELQGFIRKEMVLSIINQYSKNYHDPQIGMLLTQVSTLPSVIRDMFKDVRTHLLPAVVTLIAASIYFTWLNPSMGIITIIGFSMFITVTNFYAQDSLHNSAKLAHSKAQFYEHISDLFNNLLLIYAANTEITETIKFDEVQAKYNNFLQSVLRKSNNFSYVYAVIFALLFVILSAMIYSMYKMSKISVGQMSSSFLILLITANSLGGIIGHIRDYIYNLGTLQQTQLMLEQITDGSDLRQILQGNISIKNIIIIKDEFKLSIPKFEINHNEKILLTGPIGSGKSIFIKTLMKLQNYNGSIMYDNLELNEINGISLREQIGFIPQQPKLFNRTIIENITYGTNSTKNDVYRLLAEKGIDQLDKNNLDRLAGKNGDNLSGGQRQIVALMRLILANNPIVILDEPTAALDKVAKNKIHQPDFC